MTTKNSYILNFSDNENQSLYRSLQNLKLDVSQRGLILDITLNIVKGIAKNAKERIFKLQ